MTDAISEGATERLEEYCREAEKRRDGKIGGASDLLHEMSGPHQRLYVSDLRALLAAKEAAEAERDQKDDAFSTRIDELIDKCDALAACAESTHARADAAEAEAAALQAKLAVAVEAIGKILAACNDLENRGIDRGYGIDRDWVIRATLTQPEEGDSDDG